MKKITINKLTIGAGIPKIIIPLVGKNADELLSELFFIQQQHLPVDVIEWRADHFTTIDDFDSVVAIAKKLKNHLLDIPLLFTFRTSNEGGAKAITIENYIQLICDMAKTGLIDLVDVEILIDDNAVKQIISCAHQHNVVVIASNHDFNATPSEQEILVRLHKMQQMGADIAKIAVMPNSVNDVLRLLATIIKANTQITCPLVMMAMGELGKVTRMSGEVFGSAMTFGAAQNASAPGQIDAKTLHNILNVLHHIE